MTATQMTQAQGESWAVRLLKWLVVLVLMVMIGAALSVVAGVALYQNVYQDRIYLGVRAAGLDLGGLTREKAAEMIRGHVGYFDSERIRLTYGDKTWEATPAQLGGYVPAQELAEEAFSLGRGRDLTSNVLAQAAMYRYGIEVPIRSEFNSQPATEFVRRIAAELDRPARNASLTIHNGAVETTPGREGWEVDQASAVRQIEDRVLRFAADPVALSVVQTPPLINDVSAAKAATERLLAGPITLTFQDKTWTLARETLADGVVFYQETGQDGRPQIVPRLRQGIVEPWVESLAPQIAREAQDGLVRWDTQAGRVTVVKNSVTGYEMDVAETLKRVTQALTATERTLPVVFVEKKPLLDTTDVNALGIKELVVKGTTQFKGSPPERIQNIQVAASKFQDVLVPPGAVFSFGDHLGDVTAAEGFVEALVIVGNRTETDYGGGVCQVSTTAFRAAFFGGYPIVERTPHAYRVSYYEEGVGPGLDATVFTPQVDFKFRNDASTWLLIRTEMDVKTSSLSFLFYGTKTNREVVLEGPRILKETPAKPAIYQKDAKLKPGEVKQVDWAHPGAEVVAYRIIKEPGQPDKRETYRSVYQPWQDVFLVSASDPRGS